VAIRRRKLVCVILSADLLAQEAGVRFLKKKNDPCLLPAWIEEGRKRDLLENRVDGAFPEVRKSGGGEKTAVQLEN